MVPDLISPDERQGHVCMTVQASALELDRKTYFRVTKCHIKINT